MISHGRSLSVLFPFLMVFCAMSAVAQEEGITVKEDKVGIGTINPSSTLDVNGTLVVKDTISSANGLVLKSGNTAVYTGGLSLSLETDSSSPYDIGQFSLRLPSMNWGHMRLEARQNYVRLDDATKGWQFGEDVFSDVDNIWFEVSDTGVYVHENLAIATRRQGGGVGVIGLGNGTAPTSSPSDGIQMYAADVAGSSELHVRNENGDVSVLSGDSAQNLSYNPTTRSLDISPGTGTTLPVFSDAQAGLVPGGSGGDSTLYLRGDGEWASSGGTATFVEGTISSNISIPSINTWVSGPSVLLTAGTWLVTCNLSVTRSAFGDTYFYGRISTGTTHFIAGVSKTKSNNPKPANMSLTSMINLTGTTTIYGQVAASKTGGSINSTISLSGVVDATKLTAVKLD